jgi:hypothetical protein
MTRAVLAVALTCLFAPVAYADGRIDVRVDFNSVNVAGVRNSVGLNWQGLEVELEKEFAKSKVVLSGVAIGLRREIFYGFTGFGARKNVDRWDEGTYVVGRFYRTIGLGEKKSWSIAPAFTLLWGIPGTTLDRTVVSSYGEGSEYTHIFPVRNSEIPKVVAESANVDVNAALVYPEVSVAIRKRLARGGITFDWIFAVRIIRFGIVDSGVEGDVARVERVYVPSMGMRFGFKVF